MPIYYDRDADLTLIQAKRVAVIGYGSQGHAHALNLRDSGVPVRVGLRPGSKTWAYVEAEGLKAGEISEVAAWADVVAMLIPDSAQPRVYYEEVAPHMQAGKTLLFSHGFNIRFGTIQPRSDLDVVMVAPKAPGQRVREIFQAGQGTPALLAVHQNVSGLAREIALSYARALGATRAGVIETTFAEETETDLFGEQAVLCGGVSALIKAGFETLVAAGYQPEIAYFECLHELKLIVDLMYRGGLSYMRHSISNTAEHGDYTAGPRLVTEATREEMRRLLAEIQDGTYARKWIAENETGLRWFEQQRRIEREHLIEQVGARLRKMMPFLDPVTVPAAD